MKYDLVDVHTARASMALAVTRVGFRRMVITPHAPVRRFLAWPYSRAVGTLVERTDRIVCASENYARLNGLLPPGSLASHPSTTLSR